jgi:N-acetylmuramoyl-L-alanine amidase
MADASIASTPAQAPTIITPTYPGVQPYDSRTVSAIKLFIIHHSDGPLTETVQDINQQHLARGFNGIGYTWVITPDGKIYQGRPVSATPAAAEGANHDGVSVCLIGDFQPGTEGYSGNPTSQQIASLKHLRAWAQTQIPSIEMTIGHRDVQPMIDGGSPLVSDPGENVATACPGDNLYAMIPEIKAAVKEAPAEQAAP